MESRCATDPLKRSNAISSQLTASRGLPGRTDGRPLSDR